MDDNNIFRTHPDNVTILSQAMDVKAPTTRIRMTPTVPLNFITKNDFNLIATS